MRALLLTLSLLGFLLPGMAVQAATTNWVADTLYVPLRSGPSSKHRIVHRGLKSGTQVTVLERDDEAGFARIRTDGGTEGYIATQYLSPQPIAALRLAEAERKIAKMRENQSPMQSQLTELEAENKALREQNESLAQAGRAAMQELERIKKLSANTVAIDRRNQELLEQNGTLKHQIDELNAENGRLKDASGREWFKLGAGAILLGVIVGILLPHFRPRRKVQSGWV